MIVLQTNATGASRDFQALATAIFHTRLRCYERQQPVKKVNRRTGARRCNYSGEY